VDDPKQAKDALLRLITAKKDAASRWCLRFNASVHKTALFKSELTATESIPRMGA
jgi:hypothetical protein